MTQLSIVAGIVDKDGNLTRLVVTYPGGLRYHIGKGESVVVLPGLVQEPISNDQAHGLIQRLEKRIKARRTSLVL
jgi:hypothetical protein